MKRNCIIQLLLSVIILFFSFNNNIFNIVQPEKFRFFQQDSESLIIGRLLKTEMEGFGAVSGLLGWNHPSAGLCDTSTWSKGTPPANRFKGWGYAVPDHPDKFMFQFDAFDQKLSVDYYEIYYSSPAGQALCYSLISTVTGIRGNHLNTLCRGLNALLSSVVLTFFLFWSARVFGSIPAYVVLCGIVLSYWMILFGRNLFYVFGLFYLPFVAVLLYFEFFKQGRRKIGHVGLIVGLAVFFKCLIAGFDFITVTIVMALLPMVFYGVRDRLTFKSFVKFSLTGTLAAMLGIGSALLILAIQISCEQGGVMKGFDYLLWTLERRSLGNALGYESISTGGSKPFLYIIQQYWNSNIIDISHLINRRWGILQFNELISLFLVSSIVFLFAGKVDRSLPVKNVALLIVFWCSLLAPLSWLIIFQNHSQTHLHMNLVIWYMPFILLGFLLLGVVVQLLVNKIITKITLR